MKGTPLTAVRTAVVALLLTLTIQATAYADGPAIKIVLPERFRVISDSTAQTPPQQATKQFALDNPRVETLWEYLKRLYGYKTGIVTTSEVTDATPAAEGGHTLARALQNDIARQYVDEVFSAGARTNTKPLDKALESKLKEDVPRFNPSIQLRQAPNSRSILSPARQNEQ